MMRLSFSGFGLVLLFMAATPVFAQDINTPLQFSDNDAREAIASALPMLPKLTCGDKQCTPPTPEEFANPPIDVDDARIAMRVGIKSAQLSWCGLDWRSRTYEAMMQMFRYKYKSNMRALALLHTIHTVQYGRIYTNLQVLKTCSPETRTDLDEQNPKIAALDQITSLMQDDVVAKMLSVVLDKLPEAMCSPTKHCAPATAEEKAKPPVSMEQARSVVKAGILSGSAEHCGLDWKRRVFMPALSYYRNKEKMNDRQIAILSILHSIIQGYTATHHKMYSEACTVEARQKLDEKLPKVEAQKKQQPENGNNKNSKSDDVKPSSAAVKPKK
jgi:hypothetical protein